MPGAAKKCVCTVSSGMTIETLQKVQRRLNPYAAMPATGVEKMTDRAESGSTSQTAVAEINLSIKAVNAEISARSGATKDAATNRRNRRFASANAARLSEAAGIARAAARQIAAAKARVLYDVAKAEAAGFIVQEDFSVIASTSRSASSAHAQDHATTIRASVTELVALDEQVAARLRAAAKDLQDLSDN